MQVKNNSMKSFLIGAATSNSGKTTFTIGLLRALRQRGLRAQPFKCGPDYIDTMLHMMASGNESVNLDTFMASESHVKVLFSRYAAEADVAVVEGVMGLFDGFDRSRGSSAEMAMLLGVPVVLVVNAKSMAYSVAPLVYGFANFDKRLTIGGVVFNNVASPSHFDFLKSACADAGVECLGYVARNPSLSIPSRHLGLTVGDRESMENTIDTARAEVERNVDIDKILSL